MSKPHIYIFSKLFVGGGESIRLNIPGIDRGGAVWLETTVNLPYDEVKDLVVKIEEALKYGVVAVFDE